MHFLNAARTDVGLRRKVNEDAMLDRPEIGLWAVADGMGGAEAGDLASSMIVEGLGKLTAEKDSSTLATAACAQIRHVNDQILQISNSGPSRRVIGSTVVGLAVVENGYEVFWAGDSRAYLVRDREITQLSRDHRLVEDLVRAGMLTPEEAIGHPDENVITRAVGVSEDLAIDRVHGRVHPGDIFLLASDGLNKVVPDAEILSTIATRNPMQAADVLIELTLDRGAPDNVTVVIVRVG